MSGVQKRTRKKKAAKAAPVQKKEPEVVNCKLADNDYTGIIREGQLGAQYLDCSNAKYTWHSGIKYEGPFSMSQIEGKGKFEWQDGSSYVGELHGGKRHGQGLYVAKDGITKYQGQWSMGRRHGGGKLSFNADGSSFYEGSWKDGKKHGEGKQVWPSGNSYSGQWEDGEMRGQGTMTWYNQGQVETYSGHWEDSQPHGEGTHTWLAPEPKPDQAFKDTTSQQLNNRYKGQWQKGARHGRGTFYYANGAYYSGEWQDHVKHGKGRHVFEDGRIYDGPFENDTMTEFKAPEAQGLNFGNDDNPVRRMVDISDIQMFACPYDNRGLDGFQSQLMYLEPAKILREVYNMLLRSLGDLKELYYRYRVLLPVPGEDPFVLSAHQFWLFARDCGLITPTCMVHRLDRSVFSGPRHHIEVAPEDADEIRPITPRSAGGPRTSVMDSLDAGALEGIDEEFIEEDEAGSFVSEQSLADSSLIEVDGQRRSAAASSDNLGAGDISSLPVEALATHCWNCGTEFVNASLFCGNCGAKRLQADAVSAARETSGACTAPRVPRFRRHETSVANIHDPNGHLLFRQFVESIVRVSIARFPLEKSLEVQTQRLMKERLVPHLDSLRLSEKEPSAQKAFDFISDPDFVKVLAEFRQPLLVLFRGGKVTAEVEGDCITHEEHGPCHGPNWVKPTAVTRKDSVGQIVRVRHYGDWGAPHHQYHVCARLDKTIRVKDAFRLFHAIGLLKAMTKGDVPWADLTTPMYAYASEEDLLVIDEQEREELIQAQESGSTTPSESDLGSRTITGLSQSGVSGGMGGFGGFGVQNSMAFGSASLGDSREPGEEKRHKRGKLDREESGSRRRHKKDPDDDEKVAKDKDTLPEGDATIKFPTVATLADFAHCDFTLTPLQALRLILEVASPGSVKALQWQLDPARAATGEETIGLLEFMESELIFTEFVRLLIRISDLGTRKDFALCERTTPATRFEGFVRHIFFSALRKPYVPPLPAVDETEKGSEAARSNESAREGMEAKDGHGSNHGEAEEQEEEIEDASKEQENIDLWFGFDDYTCAEAEAQHAVRRWPSGYESEIASWV